jgi:molybdopterin-guanine dinucleotide biosynthesis protein A
MIDARRPSISRDQLTGLILAGGQGSRMGGVDKGLQVLHGRPLVEHVIERLSPQVATIAVSANRHLERYRRYGLAVFSDDPQTAQQGVSDDTSSTRTEGRAPEDLTALATEKPTDSAMAPEPVYLGPLSGIARGLATISTDWMLVVPCDAPLLPLDLAERLIEAIVVSTATLALAVTIEPDGTRQRHPVFALLPRNLAASAAEAAAGHQRKLDAWYAHHNAVEVNFAHSRAFYNANTLGDLRELEVSSHPSGH